ncbi:DUF1194 domain-containing protein [Falsiroseomonas oryzae]|uniref:DUF1194 domain-containing protein n=1 Tax=Falsiroseomonas oryzae TaxID=2766473 RepID=UPI0022EB77E3|nr:DUF1194 domain-containing protein [Roseomonas sp. MO-31]
MRRRILLGSACALVLARPAVLRARGEDGPVDLLLVLAADVSRSMGEAEIALQRDGYAAALQHPMVVEAIRSGAHAAVAMTYVEWSSWQDQRVVVPWMRIAEGVAATAFGSALREAPPRVGDWTSISGAIRFAQDLLAAAPFEAERRVVDISGDGTNNHGGAVEEARDAAVAAGITINGLPILRAPRHVVGALPSAEALETHYREMVVGGAGAFVLPAEGLPAFASAIRRKLVLEIAAPRGDASSAA